MSDEEGKSLSVVEQVLTQIPVIKSFLMEKRRQEKIYESYRQVCRVQTKAVSWGMLSPFLATAALQIPRISYLGVGGYLVIRGSLSIGAMVAMLDIPASQMLETAEKGKTLIDIRGLRFGYNGRPEQGRISVSGEISAVTQDTYLFSESILENVRLARENATCEEVKQALEQAGAAGFVLELSEEIDTVVGDGNLTLSGGQRQRIALADRKVVL